MLNIYDLESRWLKYKIKHYTPYVILLISTVILLFILNSTMDIFSKTSENNSTNTSKDESHKEKSQTILKPSTLNKKEIPTKTQIEERNIELTVKTPSTLQASQVTKESNTHTLAPSLDFMKHMQNSMSPYYEEKRFKREVAPMAKKEPKLQAPPELEKIEEIELDNGSSNVNENISEVATEIHVDQKINITRENSQNDILSVIKRFKKNNNPALSLFAAKKYYELGDYQNSYNYALITNEINSEIDASWIIFTKSLVKLGKKDMAIKTLNDYINHSHSNTAKILLDEIESGKFK